MALARVAAQHITGNGTSTSPSATLPGTPAQGDLIVVSIAWNSTGTITAAPSGYTLIPTDGNVVFTSGSTISHSVYYKVAGASESATISATLSASANWRVTAGQYNDSAGGVWTLDQSAHDPGASSTAANSGTTASTTQAAEVWVAAHSINGAKTLGTLTNSFTAFDGAGAAAPGGYLVDKVVAATGTANSGGTWSGASPWVGTIATFYSLSTTTPTVQPLIVPNVAAQRAANW